MGWKWYLISLIRVKYNPLNMLVYHCINYEDFSVDMECRFFRTGAQRCWAVKIKSRCRSPSHSGGSSLSGYFNSWGSVTGNLCWTEGAGIFRCKLGCPVNPGLLLGFVTECDKCGSFAIIEVFKCIKGKRLPVNSYVAGSLSLSEAPMADTLHGVAHLVCLSKWSVFLTLHPSLWGFCVSPMESKQIAGISPGKGWDIQTAQGGWTWKERKQNIFPIPSVQSSRWHKAICAIFGGFLSSGNPDMLL